MNTLKLAGMVLGLAVMAACASNDGGKVQSAPELVRGGGLEPQDLKTGECGLFVWSLSEPVSFTFFRKANTPKAKFFFNGRNLDLRESRAGGDIFGQFLTEQTFKTSSGDSVELVLIPGELIEDGQRIESGRLVVTDASGWVTIQPIKGVRACIPEPDR